MLEHLLAACKGKILRKAVFANPRRLLTVDQKMDLEVSPPPPPPHNHTPSRPCAPIHSERPGPWPACHIACL
jgi:hypothetical protein